MTGGNHISFAKYVAALEPSRLETVLRNRPDVMSRPWPGTLSELIGRLGSPESIRAAYEQLPLPHVELLGVITLLHTLDKPTTAGDIAQLLDADADAVSEKLADLADRALIWIDIEESVSAVARFGGVGIPAGWPIAMLLVECTFPSVRNIAGWLGVDQEGTKADVIGRITGLFRDRRAVLDLIQAGPCEDLIRSIADGEDVPFYDSLGRPTGELQWAVNRALAWPAQSGAAEIPLELALALQPPDWHVPFHPDPPAVVRTVVDPEHVEHEACAATLRLVERVTTLIEAVEREPIQLTQSGMVTVKTLRSYAKQWACSEDDAAFVIAITLLMLFVAPVAEPAPARRPRSYKPGPPLLKPTGEVSRWHDADVAERARLIAQTWWNATTAMIVHSRQSQAGGGRYQELRRAIVGVYAECGVGQGREDCLVALAWKFPLLVEYFGVADRLIHEAELVGAVALGSASTLGRGLIAEDPSEALASIAGGAQHKATFGADLTAVVFGQPDLSLSRFLDSVATRESQGAATTWRFSPDSVRRAFDSGASAASLLDELNAIAENGIPQPLEYLLGDVERTYGNVVVSAVGSVVLSEDHALLHEISAHRKLQRMGLKVVAPGVLTSGGTSEETLNALREAGYSAVPEGGFVRAEPTELVPARPLRKPVEAAPDPDLAWHAEHLLANVDDALSTQLLMIVHLLPGRNDIAMKLVRGGVVRLKHGSAEHVVHSPRVNGHNLTVWSVTTERYETFPARNIELSEV